MTPGYQPSLEIHDYDTLLIDMSHLLHRLLRVGGDDPFMEMKTRSGVYTGGVFGVVKSIKALLDRPGIKFHDVVAVWDGRPRGVSERRLKLLPGYKQKAQSFDEDPDSDETKVRIMYEDQRPKIDEALAAFGIPVINLPGREGDDVIAELSRKIQGRVLILSDDKDFYQLVDNKVHIYRGVKDLFVTPEGFVRVSGTQTPANFMVYKSIVGDPSDKIPGIEGVGDKTAYNVANMWIAPQWSVDHLDRESIIDAACGLILSDKRNKKRYQTLIDNYDIVERNYQLASLYAERLTDAEWLQATSCYSQSRGFQEQEVLRIFHQYEFRSLLENFLFWVAPFRMLTRV